ncbi:hypothetical protein TUM20985_57370 [Mycobacterium antarcticum]|uniref:hypothetical protein n=1 Tax=Mycolicibacterium sp. TUM20985 TaxID=3023370 RepID=UPI00257325B2|nr:hypothetical protein [Mycolicibacterium sp. TUM20985]BDX35190.1 hypothetical protein TUM20985_57370 [Mycolicibacterium sp. TUM20985]
MTETRDLLSQATDFMRHQPEPGWDAIADRVIAAVRATPRHGGRPLRAQVPPGDATPGHTYISEHVVRSALVVALRRRYLCVPTAIDFDIPDDAIRAVHIEVTGSYGTELLKLGDRIRATTVDTIDELLGASANDRRPVDVTITDVVAVDPLEI